MNNDYKKSMGVGAATGGAIGLVTFGPAGAGVGASAGSVVGAAKTYFGSDTSSDSDD